MPTYWLLKSEPSTYSFQDLLRDKKTNWNGIRNFQARNFLRAARPGDLALIYHSGDDKAVVGIAKVTSEPYADPDPKKPGDWLQMDLAPVKPLKTPVELARLKATPALKGLLLLKQSRLSTMPITAAEYAAILKLGGTTR